MAEYGAGGESPLKAEDAGLPIQILQEEIKVKKLTFEEASRCLNTLGKDETGCRYAYLAITAIDRKLTDISVVVNFKHVLFLDVSGNFLSLHALQVLTGMPYLIVLKVERNRVESAALKPMHFLQVLNLNGNQIKETSDIGQPLLETLELNYNEVAVTAFVDSNLNKLKQLELRNNQLFDVSGNYPKSLERLYLPANTISLIAPTVLVKMTKLEVLHLRDNEIRKLYGFNENVSCLRYLNLRNNKIEKFKEFRKLQCLPNLRVIIVTGNPVWGEEPKYEGEAPGEAVVPQETMTRPRLILLALLPDLERINKYLVTAEERAKALEMQAELLAQIMDEESSDEGSVHDYIADYLLESEYGEGEVANEET